VVLLRIFEKRQSFDRQEIVRLALYREIPDDETLARQWNELVWQMECPEVFYTYEWALAVTRAYRDSITPLLLLAYEHDSLVGVAALATDRAQQETFFLAGTTADYCDLVSSPELRQELVNGVLAELQMLGMPTLVLANLPADSATVRAVGPFADFRGYNLFSQPGFQCAQVLLRTMQQRESVRRSVRHKRERRYLKALAVKVPVVVDHLRSWDQIAPALPSFSKAHVARFSAIGRISSLASPQRITFLAELAKLLSRHGWITLSQLRAGEHPMAWQYAFGFARHWSFYQTTFDSSFREYSPGFSLILRLIEEACDSSEADFVDLGLGREDYKKRLATGTRETLHVTLARSTVTYLKVAARYHAAAAIKTSPRLEHYVRRVLGRPSMGNAQI
jgi:CelD/BcsL family acetyltransferase involved in cellulose biosynthesis